MGKASNEGGNNNDGCSYDFTVGSMFWCTEIIHKMVSVTSGTKEMIKDNKLEGTSCYRLF